VNRRAIAQLSTADLGGMGKWLHTLGYRGHITSKSRRYSTTMTAPHFGTNR
jgi:hypothetical protein